MSATCEGELVAWLGSAKCVRSGALKGVRLPVRLRRGLLGRLALGFCSFMGPPRVEWNRGLRAVRLREMRSRAQPAIPPRFRRLLHRAVRMPPELAPARRSYRAWPAVRAAAAVPQASAG